MLWLSHMHIKDDIYISLGTRQLCTNGGKVLGWGWLCQYSQLKCV